jgi:predicted phage-related endonuclease
MPWQPSNTPTLDTLEVAASADGAIKVSVDKIGGALPINPERASELERKYLDALDKSKAAEQTLKDVEGEIKDELGAHSELVDATTGRVLFSWTTAVKEVLDTKRLRSERPSLAERYAKQQATRSFRQHLTNRVTRYAK